MSKIMIFFVVLLLAACSNSPLKEQAAAPVVEGGKTVGKLPPPKMVEVAPVIPSPSSSSPQAVQLEPVKSTAVVSVNPLTDPSNILSKRAVFFDYDSNLIKEEYRPLVTAHGQYVISNAKAKMIIQGNTDERGSREYNLALGQRRADAVKQMMTVLGADASRIESVSFGEEKPRNEGTTEEAFSQNRRSDIVYQGE